VSARLRSWRNSSASTRTRLRPGRRSSKAARRTSSGQAAARPSSAVRGYQGAACEDRRVDARERFQRNGATGRGLNWLKNKAECLGAPMQVFDHPVTVLAVVERRTRVDIFHSVTHGVVEQGRNLASCGGHSLGLADARREPSVESAELSVGPSTGDSSKPQERCDAATCALRS
jgi:hypothetical protein